MILAYSDLKHETVMHKASLALAAGADFRLLGPNATMLRSSKPVVAVCAVRTGCGKSQTSRKVGRTLLDAGLRVALVRHPMPYGDLEAMSVQRFATLEDIDASHPTVEEREEYEEPVRLGMVMYAGVDYEAILRRAEQEADVIVWDGGNNDLPFYEPDLLIVVADPLRPGTRARIPPRRDESPHGRRRRDQQGRHRRRTRRRGRRREHAAGQPDGSARLRQVATRPRRRPRPGRARRCSWSTTDRR